MDAYETTSSLERMLRPVVEDGGYELVDLQLRSEGGRWVLRLLVDRPGGITLDECARLSRELSPHLDVADLLPFRYVLEVSSPGIRRPLKSPADFERFLGERIEVAALELVGGRKTFRGRNLGVDEQGNLTVEEAPEKRVVIAFGNVRRANLDPELKF
jgi:ribosome maturation factor RimP